jgi:hypothetical protein
LESRSTVAANEAAFFAQESRECADEQCAAAFAAAVEAAAVQRDRRRKEAAERRVALSRGLQADTERLARSGLQTVAYIATVIVLGACLAAQPAAVKAARAQRTVADQQRCYSNGGGLCRFML